MSNNIDLRVKLFNAVRDIPYRIDVIGRDATCSAKNKLLGEMLERIGLDCLICKGVGHWKELLIPEEILKLNPNTTFKHVFLKVMIPERKQWVVVDATWDSGLSSMFHIAKWNGLTPTPLACPLSEIIDCGKPEDYALKKMDPQETFAAALNNWFAQVRKEHT